jgi:hypothetical protein
MILRVNKSNKIFINRFIAVTLLLGSSAIVFTKIQATQQPISGESIPPNNRKNLLELRALLFLKDIKNREAIKESCKQLIREKNIDLNMPICFMTLLEEAILRRLEDAAEILIELSVEEKIPLGRKNGLGKKDGPSLLHIATYNPKTMEDLLKFREMDCEMVKNDPQINPKISELYEQTRADHPGRSYASARIVKALIDAGFDIHEPEDKSENSSAFGLIKRFVESHASDNDDVKKEYDAIGALWGYPYSARPPNVWPYCQNRMQVARRLNEMEKK